MAGELPVKNGGLFQKIHRKARFDQAYKNRDFGDWTDLLWKNWASKDKAVSKAFKNNKKELYMTLVNLDQLKKKSMRKDALDNLIPQLKNMAQNPRAFDIVWKTAITQDVKGVANLYNMRDDMSFQGRMQDRVPGEVGSIKVQAIANKRLKALGMPDEEIAKVVGNINKFLKKHVKSKDININERKFMKYLDLILEKYYAM